MNRRRGLTYIEVLIAVLLVSLASAAAIATWSLSVKAPANKRVTEMGVYIAVNEIERQKAIKYTYLTANNTPTTYWYDKYGNWLGTGAVSGTYKAIETISVIAPTTPTGTNRDVFQIRVQVYTGSGALLLEDTRVILTFGGY